MYESSRLAVAISVGCGQHTGVALRRVATQALGQDGRAGVGDRIGGILGDALVGVGIAALQDERDAADEGDHREGGDDDDLALLPTIAAGGLAVHAGAW